GDTGRLTEDNVTYNDDNTITAEANIIGYNDDGTPLYTNNICLGNSTARSQLEGITTADYHTTIDQNWFIIVGTEISTVLSDNYLWWLNGYNNGSSVEPIYAIELEDNKVLLAWEVTLTGMDGNLQNDVNVQDGWTCFGLTPTNGNGISTISDICFYSWTEAIAKYPELEAVGGEKSPTAAYITLMVAINDAENACPDTNEVFANQDVKASYEEALATAQSVLNDSSSTDDDYTDAAELLNDALESLQTSIALYASVESFIDKTNTKINEANDYGWMELVDALQEIVDNFQDGYEAETLTDEQINSADDDVTNAIADYISQYVQAGDDITLVINNPDFDTDFSGWTVTGATPAFGGDGISGGGENTLEGGIQPSDLGSGNAEVFHAVFDISQTIKNMPAGLYTLSCSGFARDDDGDGIQAELYASVNGSEQTQTLASLYSEGSEDMLYDSSSLPDLIATLTNGETAYVPNCMAGANIYFSLGYYKNQFNILVEERGDLTIGVRETNTDDWVIFDNFQLIYQGNQAGAYTDVIQELIEQAQEVQSQGTMTTEADQRINDAIDQGKDVLSGDNDDAVEAVNSLREAIAAGEASINLISDLKYLVDYTNEVRLVELISSIDDEILDVIEKVNDALEGDGFETDAEVQGYMESLKGTFNKCVIYDHLDATEANPADVTNVILTPDCVDEEGVNSHFGWELSDESVVLGESYGLIEIYNQTAGAGVEQVLYNLYAGWYRLGVQAFYRPGNTYSTTCPIEMTEEENDSIHYADLYAGSKATRVNSIFSDAKTYNELEGRASYSTYTIPNTMAEASTAFSDDLYHNTLQFEVTQDGTDVPVGLVKTGYVSGDWLIWSHWTLEYLGTTEPTEDPTTDIEGVEGNGNVVATAIYSVNGTRQSRLAKGLNIVKETLSDGTVKVSKLLVK
ncbi:MAG: hypothetical protein LUC44_00370, partial [Prevotellaceae bacterium]|nr:hypothetical protein [Prevotellaceae bacterium]